MSRFLCLILTAGQHEYERTPYIEGGSVITGPCIWCGKTRRQVCREGADKALASISRMLNQWKEKLG